MSEESLKDEQLASGSEKANQIIQYLFKRKLNKFLTERKEKRDRYYAHKKTRKRIGDKSRKINRFKARMNKGWKRKKLNAARTS
jgi:hypothetical protein